MRDADQWRADKGRREVGVESWHVRNAPRWRRCLTIEHARYLSPSSGIFAGQSDTCVFTNVNMQISFCMLEHAVGPSERHVL